MRTAPLAVAIATVIGATVSHGKADAAYFQGLGDLPGGIYRSLSWGISGDGSVVTGSSRSTDPANGFEAFRWTRETGMSGLGFLQGAPTSSSRGISAYGKTIYGFSLPAGGFYWTPGNGTASLGSIVTPLGASADGSILVGSVNSFPGSTLGGATEAFRWTKSTGFAGLGVIPGTQTFSSQATGVSADGSIVVGVSTNNPSFDFDRREAYRWTAGSGMVGLGWLPGADPKKANSSASGVSADGSVVVGSSTTDTVLRPFRWTSTTGMVALDLLQGYFLNSVSGVSADGAKIYGSLLNTANQLKGFVWTVADGMKDVVEVLAKAGVEAAGWQLTNVRGVSADGLVFTGDGINPDGNLEAWVASTSDVTPGLTPDNPLLPSSDQSDPSTFVFRDVRIGDNGLGVSQPIFIDPVVAIGYDYSVASASTNGPLFASVLIPGPLPQGDSEFLLELPGFGSFPLLAGSSFNLLSYQSTGFGSFRITGISPDELLDPSSLTAFVTGVTFTGPGVATITQQAITSSTNVPGPLPGFGLILGWRFSRTMRRRVQAAGT
jgi:probable HAF family extracellular repeat protein